MNDLPAILHSSVFYLSLTGFSIYDILRHRVPNKALLLFSPVVLTAPLIHSAGQITSSYLSAFLGAAAGFGILLAAALFSKKGEGVGGGDIKLAAMLGFVLGPDRIMLALLTATLLVMPVCLLRKKPVAFVPFLYIGCLVTAAYQRFFL